MSLLQRPAELLAALFAAGALLGGASARADEQFDVRLVSEAGVRTLAVENLKTGSIAVATSGRDIGGRDLVLLAPDAARAAYDALKGAGEEMPLDGPEFDETGKRRIIVHRMDFDEAPDADDDAVEARLIRRVNRKDRFADDEAMTDKARSGSDPVLIEGPAENADQRLAEPASETSPADDGWPGLLHGDDEIAEKDEAKHSGAKHSGAKRSEVYLPGLNARKAAEFIDDVEGLGAVTKRAIKDAVDI